MEAAMKIQTFAVKAENEKEAYVKGCKKLAKYMASKKYKNLSVRIRRSESDQNIFLFTFYTNTDLAEMKRTFCKLCKEYHSSFFVNEEYNCSRCNLNTFLSRVESKARVSKNFYLKEMN